ncbi:hypothetical protein EDI_052920 [Entamoeba dispar SAW760]|uniref:WW domain-containing protein n=1 Tax=Entamoeba dispar (strain ATCC PRA-260 / SAW760) TaxID=370354 RepID=B0ES08_ENTDS|nr:uncharacterized protein EDI_052920 [Entamoeba dispar SAW760]EDR22689.1 hypothetical protein EDI_052920 [Entamoeba dispar SAW760]|eukprot:EDR22689.1 hypothetical protein EDI_052920 [Entamoeba dispar SAW760]
MSEVNLNVRFINKGYAIGERLQGFLLINVKKRVIVNQLHFNLIGETILSRNASDKKAIKLVNKFFISRDYPPLAEQSNFSCEPFYHEYFPGTHAVPFSIIIPIVPHPSLHLKGGVGVRYRLQAKLQIIPLKRKEGSEKAIALSTFTSSNEVPILYCVKDVFDIKKPEEVCSRDQVLVRMRCTPGIKPNESIKVYVTISNNTGKPLNPIMLWYSEHRYRETYITSNGGIQELDKIPKLLQKEFILESTNLLPTIKEDDFIVESYVEIRIKLEKKPTIIVKFPVTVGWGKGTFEDNCARAALHGIDFSKDKITFYGIHMRPTPSCESVIQKVEVDGVPVYINHLWRKCYGDESCKNYLNIRYPLPECKMLPKGWGIGMDRGEMYFINWNKKYTTWMDPRSFEERKIKVQNIQITLIKGINFPTLKGKQTKFRCVVTDKDNNQIESGISTKSIDPIWDGDKSTFIVQLEEMRENVVIGFFSSKKFVGAVDLPLWRVVENGIEEWFQLKNFGDFNIPQTGEVLLRIQWEGDVLPVQPERVLMRFDPYYCNTEATKEQEKYINKIKVKEHMTNVTFKTSGEFITGKKDIYLESGISENNITMGIAPNYDVDLVGSKREEEVFDIPEDEEMMVEELTKEVDTKKLEDIKKGEISSSSVIECETEECKNELTSNTNPKSLSEKLVEVVGEELKKSIDEANNKDFQNTEAKQNEKEETITTYQEDIKIHNTQEAVNGEPKNEHEESLVKGQKEEPIDKKLLGTNNEVERQTQEKVLDNKKESTLPNTDDTKEVFNQVNQQELNNKEVLELKEESVKDSQEKEELVQPSNKENGLQDTTPLSKSAIKTKDETETNQRQEDKIAQEEEDEELLELKKIAQKAKEYEQKRKEEKEKKKQQQKPQQLQKEKSIKDIIQLNEMITQREKEEDDKKEMIRKQEEERIKQAQQEQEEKEHQIIEEEKKRQEEKRTQQMKEEEECKKKLEVEIEKQRKQDEEKKRKEGEKKEELKIIQKEKDEEEYNKRIKQEAEENEKKQATEEEKSQKKKEEEEEEKQKQKQKQLLNEEREKKALERQQKKEERRKRKEEEREQAQKIKEEEEKRLEEERKKKQEMESKAASFGVVDQMNFTNSEKELLGLI